MPDHPTEMTVLFADISGSTQLYEKLGDSVALDLIDRCIGLLKQLTTDYGGRIVKTIGDELMCAFPVADCALYAASGMQARVNAIPPVTGNKLAIRVGFHHGPVIEQPDGDVFGDSVNLAARLAGIARAGQIVTSQQTIQALTPLLRTSARHIDSTTVRGKSAEIDVFEVLWRHSNDSTALLGPTRRTERGTTRLVLVHDGRDIAFPADTRSLTIGRDPTNHIVVKHDQASRVHARIELRRGKYVLADDSTNGTCVRMDDGNDLFLKREEFILHGCGEIRFGDEVANGPSEHVAFRCVAGAGGGN